MNNISEKKCPVCQKNDIQLYMRGIYDCDTTNVMECQACGLQYLFPCMSKKDEKLYYKDYYTKQKSRYSSAKSLIDIQNESYNFYEKYVNLFLDILKETSTILEIGSGAGGFIRFVKKHYKNHKIDAIERDNINIDFIKECFNDVDVQKDTIIPPPQLKNMTLYLDMAFLNISMIAETFWLV